MFQWLKKFIIEFFDFNARCRAIDIEILWETLKEDARDLEHAREAFTAHAMSDLAWLRLGEEEIKRRIRELR